ncbi:hypothetical protein AVEN_274953-1 [Araneus ventricosus]|uniref:Endonuclease/exonuclease/phosphatase domain-containing protein n=1 Tax=Araneus ventricosus TaxID=182803 RepID=A0A4Y2QIR4_ARAVE|nr:hypothetical protein AVEN_274953-1 [Araneus ventricosus]
MAFCIVSWNYHGFRAHIDKIESVINKHQPVCICLQESYLSPGVDTKIANFNIIRKDNIHNSHAVGGVALLFLQSFPFGSFPINTSTQAVAIQIHIKILLTICSIYLPPSQTIFQNELDNLIGQLPTPFTPQGHIFFRCDGRYDPQVP